jgi:hypothetical protein
MLKSWVATAPPLSWTLTVTLALVAEVDKVPESTPPELSDNPDGSVPDAIDQL